MYLCGDRSSHYRYASFDQPPAAAAHLATGTERSTMTEAPSGARRSWCAPHACRSLTTVWRHRMKRSKGVIRALLVAAVVVAPIAVVASRTTVSNAAGGKVYYVAPNGSDNAAG